MRNVTDIVRPLMQILCLLVFECGVVCALWQVGNSLLTLSAMAAALPLLAVSRIPRRYFPECLCFVMQISFACLGLFWFSKYSGTVQIDLVLAECLSIFCLALFCGGRVGEHWVLALLSMVLGLYGGLHPGRDIYFPVFVVLCILEGLLLYISRNQAFGAKNDIRLGRNFLACMLHFTMALLISMFCMRYFVLGSIKTRGVLPVSFQTGQENEFPQLCGRWLAPAKKLLPGNDGVDADIKSHEPIYRKIAKHEALMEAKSVFCFMRAEVLKSKTGSKAQLSSRLPSERQTEVHLLLKV